MTLFLTYFNKPCTWWAPFKVLFCHLLPNCLHIGIYFAQRWTLWNSRLVLSRTLCILCILFELPTLFLKFMCIVTHIADSLKSSLTCESLLSLCPGYSIADDSFVLYIPGALPHKYKIVIAGNHELSFDPKFTGGSSIRHQHKTAHTGM